jgi:beta-galactosidase
MDKLFDMVYDCAIENGSIVVKGSLVGVSRMPFLRYTQRISIGADGKIDFAVEAKLREGCVWIPRFGYEFALKEEDAAFKYFGMGPGETYIDLRHYAGYGLWESKASKEYVPYIMPQEHGNHYGVSYLAFENGLTFAADVPFECNVSQFSIETLFNTQHEAELQKDGKTYVRIDYKNSGIGSASCGTELLPQYCLHDDEMHFAFTLSI